jgi:hypothetical protein
VLTIPVIAIAWLGWSYAPASAQEPNGDCVPAEEAQIAASFGSSTQATFTVLGSAPLCEPMSIGVASYLKDGPGFVVPQTLFDSATGTITSGSQTLAVSLPQTGTPPHCYSQVDAFTGPPLQEITESQRYGSRLLDYTWGEVPTCVEGETLGSTTTTTTTTAPQKLTDTPTTTEAPTTTTAPNTPSSSTQVSASTPQKPGTNAAGVEVQGRQLARTGPRDSTEPLIVIAGILLLIGSALSGWANWSTRRSNA